LNFEFCCFVDFRSDSHFVNDFANGTLVADGNTTGGLVFGIPLTQCVENDRLSRAAARTSPFRSGAELSGCAEEPATIGRHGSRSSFSSLIEAPRGDEVIRVLNLDEFN
jgi:hypothetical protein